MALLRLLLLVLLALPARAGDVILDARTGDVIAGRDATAPRAPASVTKLMAIMVVLDAVEAGEIALDQAITVSSHAAAAPPVALGLKAGETISLRVALHAALVLSSNDAARVLAEAEDAQGLGPAPERADMHGPVGQPGRPGRAGGA